MILQSRFRPLIVALAATAVWHAAGLAPARAGPEQATKVVYVPPFRGSPSRTVLAGTRGAAWSGRLVALAPHHVAWTDDPQPVLYWYCSAPIEQPVELMILDDVSIDPLLEVRLDSPVAGGMHAFDLARHGVRLEAGQRYRWSVSIINDPQRRSQDTFSEAFVMQVEPDAALRGRLSGLALQARAREYAGSGYWYDALRALGELIERGDDESARWRTERASLLGQVGIELGPP